MGEFPTKGTYIFLIKRSLIKKSVLDITFGPQFGPIRESYLESSHQLLNFAVPDLAKRFIIHVAMVLIDIIDRLFTLREKH